MISKNEIRDMLIALFLFGAVVGGAVIGIAWLLVWWLV